MGKAHVIPNNKIIPKKPASVCGWCFIPNQASNLTAANCRRALLNGRDAVRM